MKSKLYLIISFQDDKEPEDDGPKFKLEPKRSSIKRVSPCYSFQKHLDYQLYIRLRHFPIKFFVEIYLFLLSPKVKELEIMNQETGN